MMGSQVGRLADPKKWSQLKRFMHDRRLKIPIGLGPVVASLCLGSPANISFRSKANQANGISCAEVTLSFILSHGVSLSLEPSFNPATDRKCAPNA